MITATVFSVGPLLQGVGIACYVEPCKVRSACLSVCLPHAGVYRRLGDKFLDDHLDDTSWTFRRQQLERLGRYEYLFYRKGSLLASRLQIYTL